MDHAFASPLTVAFNEAIVPWLKDLNSWIDERDPQWLYEGLNALCRQYNWGVLRVDYEVRPIPGFDAFEAQVRDEMLAIIRNGMQQERLAKPGDPHARVEAATVEEPSPFEDVSAPRLMGVLIDTFKTRRFHTICPLIMPEQHFSSARSEAERIFQHYVSAMLVEISQRAVTRGQADGQWFLFHMSPEPPTPDDVTPDVLRIRGVTSFGPYEDASQPTGGAAPDPMEAESAYKRQAMEALRTYTAHVESELARKNAAYAGLEERIRYLEAELIKARAPRLPWKRRKHKQS